MTLQFDGWPWKTTGQLFYATSSFVHYFVAIGEFKLELQSGNPQFGSNSTSFRALWPWNLTDDLENNRAPLLCYFKLCSSFRSHWWIQTGVTVPNRPIWVKFDAFFFTSVTLTFDLQPWIFACASLVSLVITPENFVMIPWWEHSQKGVMDSRTQPFRAAWSQLKKNRAPRLCYVKLCA